MDSKAMLKENVGKKIRYNERKQVEIIKATKHYKVGQVIAPHTVVADRLIKEKIAKEVK